MNMMDLGTASNEVANTNPDSANPMKDFEVESPPDDSISSLAFSPASIHKNLLIAGSWDNNIRCWEVEQSGKTIPKSIQSMGGPVLDVCWHDNGTKVFMASCDKTVKCWDLASNLAAQVAAHDAPVKTCHWIKGSQYSCLMTGSWDKTLKFWDLRNPTPIMTINLPERCYCAHVDYPMAVVGTASNALIVYHLEPQPRKYKSIDSHKSYHYRCVTIFRDKEKVPTGCALGCVEGVVAFLYMNSQDINNNFKFKCHRLYNARTRCQDIYAVNDIQVHPVHGTLATVGSDGTFSFWDKDARSKLNSSLRMNQAITQCAFNHNGQIFAYSVSYDWAMGHQFNNPLQKNYIFIRPCIEELKRITKY